MEIADVLNHIKQNDIRSFYIFTGIEIEVQWLYIKQIAKHKNQDVKYVDDFKSIYHKFKNTSFVNKSFCYVMRDDKDLTGNEKLWVQLTDDFFGGNTVILLLTDLDKRTKFYKHYKDDIVEFKPLPEQLLIKYIQKDSGLGDTSCKKLIDICESNYGRILLEIDKIKMYRDYLNEDGYEHDSNNSLPAIYVDSVFEHLLKDGTIYQPPKDAIFDFVDAVMRRQSKRAFELLQESYDCGEATMVLLQVLYNNTKQMLQVQSCTSSDICKSTGLTSWQVKCAKDRIGKWRVGELVNLMRDLREAEVGIKTGQIEEQFAVEYVLVKNI